MKDASKNISEHPIGIFDSGLGGLSVYKEILQLIPNESIIYLADSLNSPYGEKEKDEIVALSIKNTKLLLSMNCKMIVVACNTATTNAIHILRKNYNVPFIGIEPATKPAALETKSGKIGVLATRGTLKSDLFIDTSGSYRDKLEIFETVGENLVKLIEQGKINETKPLLENYLLPMVDKGVDSIVLGCTHYPLLIPIIKEIIPEHIAIIDSGLAVAKQTKKVLEKNGIANKKERKNIHQFYTNTDVDVMTNFLEEMDLPSYRINFKEF